MLTTPLIKKDLDQIVQKKNGTDLPSHNDHTIYLYKDYEIT